MRNISKLVPPEVLVSSKADWDTALAADPSEANKGRYRHPDIKARLLEETSNKCLYCESKLRHNCPGDIEHKVPKGKRQELIFEWENLTIACSECNRRKLDYYEPTCMFLDPNCDDVESMLMHAGPFVFNRPGNPRAEVTLRLLELANMEKRRELVARKLERLEFVRHLLERIAREVQVPLKIVLLESLKELCETHAEFSGMVKAYVEAAQPDGWH